MKLQTSPKNTIRKRKAIDYAKTKPSSASKFPRPRNKRMPFGNAQFGWMHSSSKSKATKKKPVTGKEKAVRIAKKAGVITSLTILFGMLLGTLLLIGVVSAYSRDLPNIEEHIQGTTVEGRDTVIVDRTGQQELYRLQGQKLKENVTLDEVPDKLEWAFLAAEDAGFWEHKGLNLFGLSRAMLCTAKSRGQASCGGGSSVTQQLVKNSTGKDQRTVDRKIREAILAMEVEQDYSKEEILEFYLNVVPEGGILQGVKAGSIYLFGKENLNDLTLAEMAYLAGIPNQPAIYSPWGGSMYDPERSQERAAYVLDRMLEVKEKTGVTEEEIKQAKEELPKVSFKTKGIRKDKAPHYIDYVIQELDEMYKDKVGEDERGSDYLRDKGYTVVTAVDTEVQNMMQETIAEQIKSKEFQTLVGSQNAAAVFMDPRNGEIIAMVGSRDFNEESKDPRFKPQFNAAIADRSQGSTMKPVLYLSAFMNGYHPSTVVPDFSLDLRAPGASQKYYVKNYSRTTGQYGDANTGRSDFITMRTALKWSLNIPAVATYNMVGGENYADTYIKLNGWDGFRDQVKGPSAPLGAANMPLIHQTHAFATLAAEGVYHEKKVILEIRDENGNIVFDNRKSEGKQVIEKKYAYLINDLNKNYYTFKTDGLLKQLQTQMDIAGKTGTGDNDEGKPGDLAFVGYTPNMVLGMWSGNDCGSNQCPIEGTKPTSSNLYTYLYKPFLQKYVDSGKLEAEKWTRPGGVRSVNICGLTGRASSEECEKAGGKIVTEMTADTSLPKEEDMIEGAEVVKCGESVKLASERDKELNLAEKKYYVHYKYPVSHIQAQYDSYLKKLNQLPPEETCDIERNVNKPKITIISPAAGTTYKPGDAITINVSVTSDIDIEKVEVFLDQVLQKDFKKGPYEFSLTLPGDISSGSHEVMVIATDVRGESVGQSQETRNISVIANSGSTVSPTLPAEGQTISRGASPTVGLAGNVNLTSPDLGITSVQFLVTNTADGSSTPVAGMVEGTAVSGTWNTPATNGTYTIDYQVTLTTGEVLNARRTVIVSG